MVHVQTVVFKQHEIQCNVGFLQALLTFIDRACLFTGAQQRNTVEHGPCFQEDAAQGTSVPDVLALLLASTSFKGSG